MAGVGFTRLTSYITPSLQKVKSRFAFDTALISFGKFRSDGSLVDGYLISGHGADGESVSFLNPLLGTELEALIGDLKAMRENGYVGKIVIQSIRLKFSGLKKTKTLRSGALYQPIST